MVKPGSRHRRIKYDCNNPSKSPFLPASMQVQKGDFQFPPLEKGDEGGFSNQRYSQNQFNEVRLTLTLPCSRGFCASYGLQQLSGTSVYRQCMPGNI